MGTIILRVIAGLAGLLGLALVLFLWLAPAYFDNRMNPVVAHAPYEVSDEARALHATIPVADLHADTMLWNRDMLVRNDRGHVDLPRMRQGGQFLQLFTAVTKTPRGLNYDENDTEAPDDITTLAMAQRWPRRTWDSRTERAIYQAEKLAAFSQAVEDPEAVRLAIEAPSLRIIRTKTDLYEALMDEVARRNLASPAATLATSRPDWLNRDFTMDASSRVSGADFQPIIAAILGTEGSHALDGDLENIDRLYDAGFRVMGLQHFFDNRLGGSLHGTSGAGLTEFGRAAIARMREKGIIIDVAHSSEQVVRDTLAIGAGPLIVSHTGFDGHCPSPRNISDELMAAVAENGGLIGVGFWEDVTCDASPRGIADAIMWGARAFGVDHIALGSDFDGTVTTELDASEYPAITQALMDAGMPDDDIRKVMGGNTVRFFLDNLPAE